MKEKLESVDKLQADLNEANALKLASKNQAKITEDHVVILQCQVQELQSQVEQACATTYKVAELEVEFQDMIAWGGEMFIQGQYSIKKDLIK